MLSASLFLVFPEIYTWWRRCCISKWDLALPPWVELLILYTVRIITMCHSHFKENPSIFLFSDPYPGLGHRGRDAQTSLSLDTSCRSSEGTLRHSQAREERKSLQHVLGLPLGIPHLWGVQEASWLDPQTTSASSFGWWGAAGGYSQIIDLIALSLSIHSFGGGSFPPLAFIISFFRPQLATVGERRADR